MSILAACSCFSTCFEINSKFNDDSFVDIFDKSQPNSYLLHAVDNVVVRCLICSSIVSLSFGKGTKN